ncbi:3-hydroxyacyl-CoA dehydrogenase family protein [Streptomyces spectabilis]
MSSGFDPSHSADRQRLPLDKQGPNGHPEEVAQLLTTTDAGTPASDPQVSGAVPPRRAAVELFPRVWVLGLGTVGSILVALLAQAGHRVVGVEDDPATLKRGMARVRHQLHQLGAPVDELGFPTWDRKQLRDQIDFTTRLEWARTADPVIEAVPERLDAKCAVLAHADSMCGPGAVFATNTTGLSVTEIAARSGRMTRAVGIHLADVDRLADSRGTGVVEVVSTPVTENTVTRDMEGLLGSLDLTPVRIPDLPGFVGAALTMGYLNSAARMCAEGYASCADIDTAISLGCGLPVGPLTQADTIGLDVVHDSLTALYQRTGDRMYSPVPPLARMVSAGLTGRKSGQGFHHYPTPDDKDTPDRVGAIRRRTGAALSVCRVGVVGSGVMAAGIAEVCIQSGYPTTLVGRTGTTVFARLDTEAKPGTILATTTSSLSVLDCARATSRPHDVAGVHFFNPAPAMRLLEVVRTPLTTDHVIATIHAWGITLAKHTVECTDRTGFIVNALLLPYLNHAATLLHNRHVTPPVIDTIIACGYGHPLSPFQLLDLIGLDVTLTIQQRLHDTSPESTLPPARCLEKLAAAGHLGRKTSCGFRNYHTPCNPVSTRPQSALSRQPLPPQSPWP